MAARRLAVRGMLRTVRIVIVGDLDPEDQNHRATESALADSMAHAGLNGEIEWRATTALAGGAEEELQEADGVFLTTGSPYESLDGALNAIRTARTSQRPFLGTCGGFQHVVVEGFRNVAGVTRASHGEYEDPGDVNVIAALSCSLAGLAMPVQIIPSSLAASAYGADVTMERYYCQYGVAPSFRERLDEAGLTVTGTDPEGEPRIVERTDHPFFVATLFVPQVASSPQAPHPLVSAFVAAAARHNVESSGE